MSTLLNRRRAMMMSAGASIDWESIARGMTDFTTPFSVPAELLTANIPDDAYKGRVGLQSIDFPNTITTIGQGAFMNCTGLTSISLPTSLTEIKQSGFNNCTNLELNGGLPNSLTKIGQWAFQNCAITSIVIPSQVTSIENVVFYNCSRLTNVTLHNAITKIGTYAFSNTKLTTLTIPSSVTFIDNYAFNNITTLNYVVVEAVTPPTLGTNVFNSTNNCPIYVPDASLNAYKTTGNWAGLASRIFPISDLNV